MAISEIRGEHAGTLAADCVTIFREVFIPVRVSAPRASVRPGFYPDPLVPQRNPATGQPVAGFRRGKILDARYRAVNLDLWEDQNLVFWFDVAVPRETAADIYRGTVRVTADGAEPALLPVEIEVWDFTLPDGPTHENHFGDVRRAAGRHGVEPDSEAFRRLSSATSRCWPRTESTHRSLIGSVRRQPKTDRPCSTKSSTVASRSSCAATMSPTSRSRSPYGGDQDKTTNHYRSWYAYLEKKGWADRSYLYMLDEPNDAEAYQRVRQLGAAARRSRTSSAPARRRAALHPGSPVASIGQRNRHLVSAFRIHSRTKYSTSAGRGGRSLVLYSPGAARAPYHPEGEGGGELGEMIMRRWFLALMILQLAYASPATPAEEQADPWRALQQVERPVPESGDHVGNVFLEQEVVAIPIGAAKGATGWRVTDDRRREVAQGVIAAAQETIQIGKLGIGWYRIEWTNAQGQATGWTTAAVLARLAAPMPQDSPICVDSATAWFARDDPAKQQHFARLAALSGVNWIRDRMLWRDIQPTPGEAGQRNNV